VCEVTSLERASDVLDREGMLGATRDGQLRAAPDRLQGVDLRFVASRPVEPGAADSKAQVAE
jgi:hypothetical protein